MSEIAALMSEVSRAARAVHASTTPGAMGLDDPLVVAPDREPPPEPEFPG
jgi:hypothetical protein